MPNIKLSSLVKRGRNVYNIDIKVEKNIYIWFIKFEKSNQWIERERMKGACFFSLTNEASLLICEERLRGEERRGWIKDYKVRLCISIEGGG